MPNAPCLTSSYFPPNPGRQRKGQRSHRRRTQGGGGGSLARAEVGADLLGLARGIRAALLVGGGEGGGRGGRGRRRGTRLLLLAGALLVGRRRRRRRLVGPAVPVLAVPVTAAAAGE